MTNRFGGTCGLWKSLARSTGWWAALCSFVMLARGANLTAGVDRSTVALGETVTFSLAFDGVNINQPSLPAIPNFQVVGQGSSMSMDITRGVSQQTFTYQLAPSAVGDFTIPGLQFNAGGQPLRTQPIKIKVVKPGDAVTTPGAAMPAAFVKIITPKKQLYVGEVSEIEVHVYFQEVGIRQYPQLPVDAGVAAGKWLSHTESRTTISNQLYAVFQFKLPCRPLKAGLVTLGPASVVLYVPDRTRRDFFGRFAEREVRLATEQASVQALPVPEQNVPPTFAGAVGNFSLAVTAAPTNLNAGDPITVRVKIAGRGALEAVRLPPQPEWNEFKTYPATSQIEGVDANNNAGTKSFEQVVVPERAGIKALPPFAFSFFDPDQKTFRTLGSAAIPLTVGTAGGGTAALPSLPGASNAAPVQPVSELAPIKVHLGAAAPGPLLLTQPWFLGLQIAPPVLWLGLFALRKHRERLANDPRLRRRGEVAQKVRRGLAELREHATAKNSDAFFATVARLSQEQIGERVDAPANAITEAVVEERLRPAGASGELCAAVHKLFQACNLARYAPVKSGEELSALVPELEQTLRELQRWEPER